MIRNLMILILLLTTLLSARKTSGDNVVEEDLKKISIELDELNYYEINVRNYTKQGNFSGVKAHLPRLKKMGVDVLCLLPIYPIGIKHRTGELGDPYFIKNYTTINPELGDRKEFRSFVDEAHKLGLKIVLDWDGYKMSSDNYWSKKKKWFNSKSDKKYKYPDYENDDLCDAMRDAMFSWLENYQIDGFRCFNTDSIPLWYWEETWKLLNDKKEMIAISVDENKELLKAGFNVLYSNGLYEILKGVVAGEASGRDIENYVKSNAGEEGSEAHYLNYISNHFENTYNGPLRDRIGNPTKLLSIMTIMLDGNPLVFNGQEAGLGKSLNCCEKDEIPWYSYIRGPLFTKLLQLRHTNNALKEGLSGGKFKRIQCTDNGGVLAFQRTKGKHRVVVMMNLSDRRRLFKFTEQLPTDLPMYDLFNDELVDLSTWNGKYKDLDIWGYHIYTTK